MKDILEEFVKIFLAQKKRLPYRFLLVVRPKRYYLKQLSLG